MDTLKPWPSRLDAINKATALGSGCAVGERSARKRGVQRSVFKQAEGEEDGKVNFMDLVAMAQRDAEVK